LVWLNWSHEIFLYIFRNLLLRPCLLLHECTVNCQIVPLGLICFFVIFFFLIINAHTWGKKAVATEPPVDLHI